MDLQQGITIIMQLIVDRSITSSSKVFWWVIGVKIVNYCYMYLYMDALWGLRPKTTKILNLKGLFIYFRQRKIHKLTALIAIQ